MKRILLIIVIVALGGLFYMVYDYNKNRDPYSDNIPEPSLPEQEKAFESSDFSFSLTYPGGWSESTDYTEFSPKFNFYASGTLDSSSDDSDSDDSDTQLPFDHFDNVTHTSVYPKGIPTENLIGQTISVEESGIDFPYELSEDSRVYVLETGEPFAAYLKPINNPDNWNTSGFIWSRVRVDNLETRCERDGEVIPQDQCDPMVMGDDLIWNGDVDTEKWQEAVSVVESFNFTVDIGDEESQGEDLIVENPEPNQFVSSPIELEGSVRGTWLFEATAPVVLTDWDGRIIAEGYIETEDDWMTESYVDFSGTLEFESPEDVGDFSDKGSIIFQKSNPSGLPQNDDAVEYNIRFR